MQQDDVILVDATVIVPKSIQEDAIPRDGGLWPEYAHTMMICVDSCEDGLVNGRLYSHCFPETRTFHCLDQMLLILEDVLDENMLVQAWNEPRSLTKKAKRRKSGAISRGDAPVQHCVGKPSEFRALRPLKGKTASFYLRVYSRQNASMQGILVQVGRENHAMAFRSALELVRMIHGVLNTARPNADTICGEHDRDHGAGRKSKQAYL